MLRTIKAAVACAAVALSALVAVPAQAQDAAHDQAVSALPASGTPHVLDGEVFAVAEVGDIIVLGGRFTQARNDADGSPVLSRSNILAFDKASGEILDSFKPVMDDAVRSLATGADGTSVYVGGLFRRIDGQPAYKIAKLDVRTGAPVAGFAAPIPDMAVMHVVLSGNRLVIGGYFTQIGSTPRSALAELDPTTGALRPGIASSFAATVWGGDLHVYRFDITPDGSTMVAIGNFRTVDGQSRVQAVKLDLTTSPATVTPWRTTRFEIRCGSSGSTKFDVRDVDFSPDGSYFVIGATGGHPPVGALCDGVSRWETTRNGSAEEPTWFDLTGGDSVYSVAATGAAVYVGGHFRWFNNPVYVQSFKGPGAVDREGIAALDPVNGVPLSWNPGRDRGRAVWDMLATEQGLWVGSDTDRIGRHFYHGRIALLPLAGGTNVPQPAANSLPVDLHLAAPSGAGDTLVKRRWDGVTAGSSVSVPGGGSGWTGVVGAFAADGKLYSARTDKTLTVRSFDGAALGTPTPLNLNGLTAFANELPTINGFAYDRGRLYYTIAGQNNLYMRYFTVESGIIGATRFTVTAGLPGIDWSTVRDMTITSGKLWWSHSSDGTLHRTDWAADAPVAGTDLVKSGPAVDGVDWRASAIFSLPAAAAPVAVATASCSGLACTFDGTPSSVSDGPITAHAWTFGDGAVGSGATASHTFAAPGTYTATLTVTGWRGTTAQAPVTVTVTNAAPIAAGTVSCTLLTCSVDASPSDDADGTIAGLSWDFGDGRASSQSITSHTYGAPGDYTVTLTVTDNLGTSSSAVYSAQVATSSIAFVASAANTQQTTTMARAVTVPSSVIAGDTMLLFLSTNSGTATAADPAGWSRLAAGGTTATSTVVWARTATAMDAQSAVTVTTSVPLKGDLNLAAYRGAVVPVGGAAVLAETQTVSAHLSAPVTVSEPGSWLVSYWSDKSADTTSWTAPAGVTVRRQSAGTGAGHVSELLSDSNGAVAVGPGGSLVATASAPQRHAVGVTVVLAPAG